MKTLCRSPTMRVYSPNLYTPKSWYENHSENFSRKGDSEGKLDFSVIFCPKTQNWAKNPLFEGVSGLFKDLSFIFVFYMKNWIKMESFIKIGETWFFSHFLPQKPRIGPKNPNFTPYKTQIHKNQYCHSILHHFIVLYS